MVKIFLTGGAGFIGSHVADELVAHGHEVTIVDNLSTGRRQNIAQIFDKVRFVEADIRDIETYEHLLDSDTVIVNLAAFVSVPESIESPIEAHEINVNGTHALMVAAKEKGVKKFISASSAAVYGIDTDVPVKEDSAHAPCSPYGLHKSLNEQYGKMYSELYGTNYIFFRFFNVYGPRQAVSGGYAAVIPIFIQKALLGQAPQIFGDGETSRDFIFVKDVSRQIRLAVEKDVNELQKFNVFNVGTGKETTLNNLWKSIAKAKDLTLDPTYGPERVGDIKVSFADVSKSQEIFGFEADTGLDFGIKETVEYFEQYER